MKLHHPLQLLQWWHICIPLQGIFLKPHTTAHFGLFQMINRQIQIKGNLRIALCFGVIQRMTGKYGQR